MASNQKNKDEQKPLTVKSDAVVSIGHQDEPAEADADGFDQSRKKNLKYLVKDTKVILLFLFLYTIQSILYGFGGAIQLIMSSKGLPMNYQGIWSLGGWPFTLRLLYVSRCSESSSSRCSANTAFLFRFRKCPLIDSVYLKTFGRRKTWLIPTQLVMGIVMVSSADYVNDFLENKETASSKSRILKRLVN